MALDLHGFVTAPNQYEGLYKVADDIDKRNQRKMLQQQESVKAAKEKDANKISNAKFLTNYLDPKDHLSGSNYDPITNHLLSSALNQALDMSNQDVPLDQIVMGIGPLVNKVNDYTSKAKMYTQNKKAFIDEASKNKGYDPKALNDAIDNEAFYTTDPKTGQKVLKDINDVDPAVNYGLQAIKNNPYAVTTDEGIKDYIDKLPKFTNTDSVKRTNSRGGSEMRRTKITAPAMMTVDNDGNLVPKFQIATDEGHPVMHEFTDEDGNKKNAPVRLLDEKEFDNIMSRNHSIADWVRGQVMNAGQGTDLNSPKAKNVARAILYDEFKRRGAGSMEDAEETKANPAPRINIRVNANNSTTNKDGNYGNEFDNLGDHTFPSGAKIEGGVMYNNDGSKKTGKVSIPMSAIPATLEASLQSIDKDNLLKKDDGFVTFDVVDGVPQSVETKKGFSFKRNANTVGQQNIGKGAKFEGNKPFGERGKESHENSSPHKLVEAKGKTGKKIFIPQ